MFVQNCDPERGKERGDEKVIYIFFVKQNKEQRKKQDKKNLLPRHHELYIGRQKQNTRFNKKKTTTKYLK